MNKFECQNCSNTVWFDSTSCVRCGLTLGYACERFQMSALVPRSDGSFDALATTGGSWRLCDNAARGVCNWLVPAEVGGLCVACGHNRVIPDLSDPANPERWRKMELAKRYMFYSLMRWGLPILDRRRSPERGLAFDFLSDTITPSGAVQNVLTGHDSGLITINIAEADDPERERRRATMGETYRTLLGHFRHEIGHYYWDLLVRDQGRLDAFRAVFGDERADYAAALKTHYERGAPPDWPNASVSAYATAHPWEDFAETFAHYMHIVDGLETAAAQGLRMPGVAAGAGFQPYDGFCARALIDAWAPLTLALNAVNRSMGQPDFYPFVISEGARPKLQFVHDLVHPSKAVPRAEDRSCFGKAA